MLNRQEALRELTDALKRLALQRQQEFERQPMNSRDFMYWLNGYLELSETTGLTQSKLSVVRQHLKLAIQTEAEEKHLAMQERSAQVDKLRGEANTQHYRPAYGRDHAPAGC